MLWIKASGKIRKISSWLLQRKMNNWLPLLKLPFSVRMQKNVSWFRITYRPQYDEKMAKEEADYIDEVLTRGSLALVELRGDRIYQVNRRNNYHCVIKTSSSFGEAEIVDTLVFKGGASRTTRQT